MRALALLIALSLTALGQRHKLEGVNSEKPEGKLLQQIMQENDAAKKSTLLEQFASQYPKDPGVPWVLEQLQAIYVKANDTDKIIAAGDQLLALDPGDPEAALQTLKAAETKKDPAAIKKYSAAASAAARKIAATPEPKEADAVTAWKNEVDYAKQVDNYADYAAYRAAMESRDPKVVIELGSMLVDRSPKGEYGVKMQSPLFVAYRQAGDTAKAVALAEKVVATDQSNEDMLLVVADSYLQQKKRAGEGACLRREGRGPDGSKTQARRSFRRGLDESQEPGDRDCALPQRQALLQRNQLRERRYSAARLTAAGGCIPETGGAVHAGLRQLQAG